ncbi:MAG: iron ABC transporter permease [Saprospiraceae bacterium]|nr:iron ABC transporter permease [Saprospiraceae bacterium]
MQQSRQLYKWLILCTLLVSGILLSILWGSVELSIHEIWAALLSSEHASSKHSMIIWEFRLPKILTALLAGGSLAIAGLLMQTFFRNPIAGPFVLGISSGASLGVALLVMGSTYLIDWGWITQVHESSLVIGACLGALAVLSLLLSVAWRIQDMNILLILGLMFGSATSALVSLLQFFSAPNDLQRFVFWSMGNLSGLSWSVLGILLLICSLFWVGSFLLAKPLNILLLGENYARSMGLNLLKIRFLVIFITAILTGAITAFCGPIAFIGIVIPHLARMLFKTYNHHILIPASILLGMIVLLFCQFIAQLPGNSQILPINIVTSFLGAPVIILLLLRKQ